MSASSWHDRLKSAPSTAHHIGGLDANPIEQLHARTVQRILKEYPEYSYSHPSEASVLVTMSSSKKQTMTWDGKSDGFFSLFCTIFAGMTSLAATSHNHKDSLRASPLHPLRLYACRCCTPSSTYTDHLLLISDDRRPCHQLTTPLPKPSHLLHSYLGRKLIHAPSQPPPTRDYSSPSSPTTAR